MMKLFIRSLFVSILSVVFLISSTSFYNPTEYTGKYFYPDLLSMLPFAFFVILPFVLLFTFILNIAVRIKLNRASNDQSNAVYFLYSVIMVLGAGAALKFLQVEVVPVVFFILMVLIIILNRKIVWNNFKHGKQDSQFGEE